MAIEIINEGNSETGIGLDKNAKNNWTTKGVIKAAVAIKDA